MPDPKTYALDIEGMDCNHCATTVTRFLEKQGLRDVSVDFASGRATFSTEQPLDRAAIATGIKGLGYAVKSTDAHAAHTDHDRHLAWLLALSAACTAPLLLHMLPGMAWLHNAWLQAALSLPPLFVGLYYFGKNSVNALKVGVLHMDVLVLIGVVSAFVYSAVGTLWLNDARYMFFETSASIVTLVLLGHYIEHRAIKRTRRAVNELQALMPDTALRINFYGNEKFEVTETVPANQLTTNDYMLVRSGDKIAADGEVVWGSGAASEDLLTGEAEPQPKTVGDRVLAGSVLASGTVKVRVTATGSDTLIASIVELVNRTQAAKSAVQRLADKITTVFVPAVLVIALVTFLVNHFLFDVAAGTALMRAVAVLVIACPCAMGLATPTAVVVGLGIAARKGILIKDAGVLERMRALKKVVFDKTGTLTTGTFEVITVRAENGYEHELKRVIASLEKHSSHPIARSLAAAFGNEPPLQFNDVVETPGTGIEGSLPDGTRYNIAGYSNNDGSEYGVTVRRNGSPIGTVLLRDAVRSGSERAVRFFNRRGIETILLSGDHAHKAEALGHSIGMKKIYGGMVPQQKLQAMEHEMNDEATNKHKHAVTMMVGDGVNDAPAMAQADIGVALSHGSMLTAGAAQIILLNSRIELLPTAYNVCNATYRTIRQNLFWAFIYNVIAIPFAACGLLSPIIAAGAMAMSDVVVIGNALRLRLKKF